MKLTPFEAESKISNINKFSIDKIATLKYQNQSELISRLNIESHQQVGKGDEFIADLIISCKKTEILILMLFLQPNIQVILVIL